MANHNYVCFACRAVRRAEGGQTPRCPECGQPLRDIGKRGVPPKSDRREWARIQSFYERPDLAARELWQRLELAKNRKLDAFAQYIDNRGQPGKAARRRFRKAEAAYVDLREVGIDDEAARAVMNTSQPAAKNDP